jgi:hypothetical protein
MPSSGNPGDAAECDGVEAGACDWQPIVAAEPVPNQASKTNGAMPVPFMVTHS